jgi:hypothetical protein
VKRALSVTTLLIAVLAAAQPQSRPPVPDVAAAVAKQEILKNCKVPASVVVLPPLVEPDFRACSNAYYKPDIPNAEYSLSVMFSSAVKVESITEARGLLRVYEINASVGNTKLHLLCDEQVKRCYEIADSYTFPEKKEKK